MARLDPVMRSREKFFQVPVVSGVHWMLQVVPALKLCPGPGAVGTTAGSRDKDRMERANSQDRFGPERDKVVKPTQKGKGCGVDLPAEAAPARRARAVIVVNAIFLCVFLVECE